MFRRDAAPRVADLGFVKRCAPRRGDNRSSASRDLYVCRCGHVRQLVPSAAIASSRCLAKALAVTDCSQPERLCSRNARRDAARRTGGVRRRRPDGNRLGGGTVGPHLLKGGTAAALRTQDAARDGRGCPFRRQPWSPTSPPPNPSSTAANGSHVMRDVVSTQVVQGISKLVKLIIS